MALYIHLWEWNSTSAHKGTSNRYYRSIVDLISPTPPHPTCEWIYDTEGEHGQDFVSSSVVLLHPH